MVTPFWDQAARKPRHRVDHAAAALVEILRGTDEKQDVIQAELGDVSRNGAQLRVRQPLSQGERIILRIGCQQSSLDFRFSATVRWQHLEDAAAWSVGCQFEDELGWEEYGELFLHGILESE